MNEQPDERAVAETLRRMRSMEQWSRAAFGAAVLLEGAFLATFLLMADFKDRTHLLLLLSVATLLTLGALSVVWRWLASSIDRPSEFFRRSSC